MDRRRQCVGEKAKRSNSFMVPSERSDVSAGEHARSWGVFRFSGVKIAFLGKGEPMQKLVWRVKLVADLGDEAAETEVEVARIERDEFTVPETLGLSLAEGKRLTAATQTEMVRGQAATMGERSVSTILRQPGFEFKLGILVF
jgi:hypothetical protein